MNPKEKAKELVFKYAAIGAGEKDNPDETAIESALIAVDEILSFHYHLWWVEVKKEIKKL